MEIEYEKRRALQAIPEIEQQAHNKNILLSIDPKSLSIGGNSFAADGISYQEGKTDAQKIRVKITNSLSKSPDFEREEFMYGFIRRLGYPSPSILLSGCTSSGNRFIVREYIMGTDLRQASPEILERSLPALLSFFTDLHSQTFIGFGLLKKVGQEWRGEFDSWIEALAKKARSSFFRINQAKIPVDSRLLDRLLRILDRHSELLAHVSVSVLHGDAGLINFIGSEKGLTGIIDTEFALVGDQAYEFSDKVGRDRDYSMNFISEYLDRMEKKGIEIGRDSFLKRGVIYSPFIVTDIIPNLWEAGNHDSAMYFISILQEEIEKAESV